MPRSPRQLVGTFADLILYNHELTVNCDACQHRAPLSVPALAARLGENCRVQAFIERAVCSKCGALAEAERDGSAGEDVGISSRGLEGVAAGFSAACRSTVRIPLQVWRAVSLHEQTRSLVRLRHP